MNITLWTPMFSFLIFVLFYAIGDWISNLTKSKVSGMLVAMLLYLIGFQTGLIPATSINDTRHSGHGIELCHHAFARWYGHDASLQ